MLSTLVVTVAIAATPATAALVWGGGKTKADAEKWVKAWADASAPFQGLYTLPAGHPRIVESAKVKGMKPGFHVVLLGVCPAAELAPRLKLFKGIYAGTYARRVSGVPVDCPTLAAKTNVKHTESVTAGETVLTLSHLDTPRGELMRATHMSRAGALLTTEGFDTPRKTASVCLGGFKQVGESFEVTLCESTKEKNVCCASRKLLTLSVDGGKLKQEAGAAKAAPAAPPAAAEPERPCDTTKVGADFELVVCEAGRLEQGPGFVEKKLTSQLKRGGKTADLDSWSDGWEWGAKHKSVGVLATSGGNVLVLQFDSYGEGAGLDSKNTTLSAWSPDLAQLWSLSANEVTAKVEGGELKVKARTVIGGEPEHEDVDEDEFVMQWQDGKLLRKP
ncbi:MAG: hypothetical protein JNK82_11240 [Myxococcaceae bacterium]|nr:hypothetical protein [Myxococcaceae bacterium]